MRSLCCPCSQTKASGGFSNSHPVPVEDDLASGGASPQSFSPGQIGKII